MKFPQHPIAAVTHPDPYPYYADLVARRPVYPPIQNTRRFLARSGTLAGHAMREDDGVLVVLAAANRDPSANANPDRFDIFRQDRRGFTFGVGVHACPGEALATTIAAAGIAGLMRSGVDLERLSETMSYRPSANTRVPLFGRCDSHIRLRRDLKRRNSHDREPERKGKAVPGPP